MIDQIKKEIERRIERYTDKWHVDDTHNRVRAGALEELLSFIDSLEKEPEVDLEKEIHGYFNPYRMNLQFDRSKGNTIFKPEQLIKFARHFYELGKSAN